MPRFSKVEDRFGTHRQLIVFFPTIALQLLAKVDPSTAQNLRPDLNMRFDTGSRNVFHRLSGCIAGPFGEVQRWQSSCLQPRENRRVRKGSGLVL